MAKWFLMVCCLIMSQQAWSKTIEVTSPSRIIRLSLSDVDKKLSLDVWKGATPVVRNIELGLMVDGRSVKSFDLERHEEGSFSEKWRPVWGKQSEISNTYNELTLHLQERGDDQLGLTVEIRVYDDGVALRYGIPKRTAISEFTIDDDLTSFEICPDAVLYAPNGENHNIGPLKTGTLGNALIAPPKFQTPTVFQLADTGYLAVHEAAIFDLSYSMIEPLGGNRFKFAMESSRTQTPMATAWRVFMMGDRTGDLLESNLLANLNPPCALEDTSWIIPGVSLWDWRALGATVGDFTYGADQTSYKRFIDFAAEWDIPYMLFDAEWYGINGPTSGREGVNMEELVAYAAERDVGVLLYVDRRRKGGVNDWDLEEVLKTFNRWGVRGIKYGFLGTECQSKQELVLKTRQIVELCAKYHLLADFHDHPVPPSGDSRTWPNLIAREYCHAQSDARRAFTPETFTTAAIINGIAGALDMNNGYFDLNALARREKIGESVPSTAVAEAARAFIVFSGLTVLPDHPDAYADKSDLFEFVRHIAGSWDETNVLEANVGKYIVVARRSGNDWVLGGATNSEARELEINLDFLKERRYAFTIFADGQEASAFGDKEDYTVKKETIRWSKGDTYRFRMAPGGGHALLIKRIDE